VADPVRYLFQLRDQTNTLREVSETAFREVIAQYDLASLLNGDARAKVAAEAGRRVQRALDVYQSGVIVTNVYLTDLQLPDAVLTAQRDAAKAEQERQSKIDEAQAYANDIIPKAQITVQRELADADVYAKQTVANAQAEGERFSQLASAYAQSPDVTRSRMYFETMENILTRSRKIVIDTKGGGGNVIYVPLDKLSEAVRAAPAAAAAATAVGGPAPAPVSPSPSSSSTPDHTDPEDRGRERPDR
jgi:membrane protease subunit HflK